MDLKQINWKETFQEAFTEVFNEVKDDAAELIKTQILPGIKAAKDGIVNDLKAEAASGSALVKIKNGVIVFGINIICAVGDKIIDKIFAPTETTAAPVADATTTQE